MIFKARGFGLNPSCRSTTLRIMSCIQLDVRSMDILARDFSARFEACRRFRVLRGLISIIDYFGASHVISHEFLRQALP